MRGIAILLGFAGGLIPLQDVLADTIHVPADYATIHEALDAASSGDIVEVAPGTYDQFDTRPAWFGDNVSAIGFLKDGVTLTSSDGPSVTTLRLDNNTARPVILMGDSGDFNVSGFTLTGSLAELIAVAIQTPDGEAASLSLHDCIIRDYGTASTLAHEFAIDTYNADVQIQDCSVTNLDSPGAIAVSLIGGDAIIEDSSFENCSGGALELGTLFQNHETLAVRRCSFVNNGSSFLGKGAVSAQIVSTALVEDSWFFQNEVGIVFGCEENGGGGYFTSSLTVRNNTFAETSGAMSQASICAIANHGELTGNTFYGGASGATALSYVGIGLGGQSDLLLERNVFSFSTGAPAVEVSFFPAGRQVEGALPTVVTSACNVYWQNAGGHTAGFSLGATDLVSDPQFCNAAAQDFTVNSASPCLPWNNDGCGQIGAWGQGCGGVSVEPNSWGQIKAFYR